MSEIVEHAQFMFVYFGLLMSIFSTFEMAKEKRYKTLRAISFIALVVFAIVGIAEAITVIILSM